MKFKKEYALLGIVILALTLYLCFNQEDRIHYDLPQPSQLDPDTITRIEITKGGQTLTLTRQDDQWRLTPGDYPADTAQVERMLKSVAELTVTALVSETQSYARYDLDADRKIEVRAFKGDKNVRQFAIGKAAGTFRHTHVLVGEDKNVYHAAGSFRWEFDKPVDDLRDKTVLNFDRAAITTIALEADGKPLVVKKQAAASEEDTEAKPSEDPPPVEEQTAPPAARWVTAEGETVDPAAVEQFLSALAPLKCNAFLDADQKAGLADPQYRLQLGGTETKTLEVYTPLSDTETDFVGTSSDSPYPFKLTEFDVEKIKEFYGAVTGTGDEAPSPAAPQ